MRQTATVALVLGLATTAALAQMPASPTGRMAGALAELAASESPGALEAFVAGRVAESAPAEVAEELAILRRECAGGKPAGARKTGGYSAVLVLELPAGRCEVEYEVESEAPHGLLRLGLGVMMGGPPPGGLDLDLPTGDDAALAAALDRKLQEMAAADEFSGVVVMARGGEPFFHRAYGFANREAKRANTVDTRFDIGSITKLLTRIAVAQLAASGKLDLEATVQSVMPDYPNREVGSRITVQHLLDHSSGLGDIFNDRWTETDKSKLLAPRDFFPLFVDDPLAFEPGSSRAYSNAGFVLLGAIVERASGMSYPDYLAEKIFAPAGMKDSGFPIRDGSDPGLAVGYTRQGADGPTELASNLGRLPIRGCPAGSSSHTAADLVALDRALRGGKLLDDAWTAWVYTGEREPDPARGWQIGVAGGGPGVSAILEGDGEATVVVVSNFDPPAAEQLGIELYRALESR